MKYILIALVAEQDPTRGIRFHNDSENMPWLRKYQIEMFSRNYLLQDMRGKLFLK